MTPAQQKKIDEATEIIAALGIPIREQTPRRRIKTALALLAVARIEPETPWKQAATWGKGNGWAPRTRDMISFWNEHYGQNVSPGSYDDVRRKDLVLLVQAGLVLPSAANPDADTNNPTRGYAVPPESADALITFGTPKWPQAVKRFIDKHGILAARLERIRKQHKVPVLLPDGATLELSSGPHNHLQKAAVEEFLERFAGGAELLYLGDTSKKILVRNEARLKELGFFELSHDRLPDIVAYHAARNLLFLIEAVHSSNPISKVRHLEFEKLTAQCTAPRVYVSVFKDRPALRKWIVEISWETEVWLTDSPDHLIHFDGTKFLGPYIPEDEE